MVEHTQNGPQDPDFDRYREGSAREQAYTFGRSAKTDYGRGESVPLFLSDPDGDPDPGEYDYYESELPRSRMSVSLKILIAVVAAAGVAMMFAMATSDATRDVIVTAKAAFIGATPTPAAAAQPEVIPQQANTARFNASDVQAKNPGRGPVVAMAPSREDISSAYQNAAQGRAAPAVPAPPAAGAAPTATTPPVIPAPVANAPASPAPVRVIDANEMALLMKRAKEMLAAGDIPVARLLLRRAADAHDPTAAFMLAQTYDPDVLGTADSRNIIPDPEAARAWYQKAAQFGSAEAQRRLAQMQK
jgi:hypothetical protein